MTKRATLYVAAGCLIYLVALIATLPAPWVSRTIERTSEQTFLLRDPAGTAWTGSGRIYLRQRSGDLLDLGVLHWDTALSGVLTGKLAAELVLGGNTKIAHLELSAGGTTIRDLSLELPGNILASVAPGVEALGPRGKILVRSDNLRIDGDSIFGLADVEWRRVKLKRAQGLDLGSHIAHLRGGGSKIDIELGTVEGALRLSGGGTWTRAAGLDISGVLQHGEDRSGALGPFLQGVCSEYRAGRCAFRFKN